MPISSLASNNDVFLLIRQLESEQDLRTQTDLLKKNLNSEASVVRAHAMDWIRRHRRTEFSHLITETLYDERNYRDGKPMAILMTTLNTIRELKILDAGSALSDLLRTTKDIVLQKQIIRVLEDIYSKSFSQLSISDQAFLWKRTAQSQQNAVY